MKKVFFLALCTIFYITNTNAQSFHFGGKAGANLGKIEGQSFKSGFNLGYQLGAFVELDLNRNWGIQPEILFSQTNTSIDSGFKSIYQNIDNAVIGDKVHLNYLNIPVLLRLNAGNLLTFHVGPQFSVLMNNDKTLAENSKAAFKGNDVAIVLGAQLNFAALRVYGRYNIGLTNVNEDSEDKWKQQQVQLGVGFKVL